MSLDLQLTREETKVYDDLLKNVERYEDEILKGGPVIIPLQLRCFAIQKKHKGMRALMSDSERVSFREEEELRREIETHYLLYPHHRTISEGSSSLTSRAILFLDEHFGVRNERGELVMRDGGVVYSPYFMDDHDLRDRFGSFPEVKEIYSLVFALKPVLKKLNGPMILFSPSFKYKANFEDFIKDAERADRFLQRIAHFGQPHLGPYRSLPAMR